MTFITIKKALLCKFKFGMICILKVVFQSFFFFKVFITDLTNPFIILYFLNFNRVFLLNFVFLSHCRSNLFSILHKVNIWLLVLLNKDMSPCLNTEPFPRNFLDTKWFAWLMSSGWVTYFFKSLHVNRFIMDKLQLI